MKQELEKLWFRYDEFLEVYELSIKSNIIRIKAYGYNFLFIFKYNHEKIKRLIDVLRLKI